MGLGFPPRSNRYLFGVPEVMPLRGDSGQKGIASSPERLRQGLSLCSPNTMVLPQRIQNAIGYKPGWKVFVPTHPH